MLSVRQHPFSTKNHHINGMFMVMMCAVQTLCSKSTPVHLSSPHSQAYVRDSVSQQQGWFRVYNQLCLLALYCKRTECTSVRTQNSLQTSRSRGFTTILWFVLCGPQRVHLSTARIRAIPPSQPSLPLSPLTSLSQILNGQGVNSYVVSITITKFSILSLWMIRKNSKS